MVLLHHGCVLGGERRINIHNGKGLRRTAAIIAGIAAALVVVPAAQASHAMFMSSGSGPPGLIVRIHGQPEQGYAHQPCMVKFDGETVPVEDGQCEANESGVVDERFTVPSVVRGATYDVEFWSADGEFAAVQDTFRFYVPPPPAISVSPTQGTPGTTVRVTGSDFASPCAVHFDQNQQVGPAECDVTGNGTIDETFRIPSSAVVGDHNIRACARCGRSGQEWAGAGFRVTEPPTSDEPTASDEPTSDQPTSEPPVPPDEPATPPTTPSDTEPSDKPTRPERLQPNLHPRAGDDAAITEVGATVRIDVTANDHDPDGELNLNSVRLTSRPRNGTAHMDQHVVVYEPGAGFLGDDSLTYRVCDDGGACDAARISITVVDPPTPTSDDTTPSERDECPPFDIRHLAVDPDTGPAGTPVRISIAIDADEECLPGRLRLTLNGEPLGDPIDVGGDGASFDWLAPEGLAPGAHIIAVEDEASARSLAEAPFELVAATSGGARQSPLLPAAATGALLLGGASVTTIARRRRRLAGDPCASPRKRVDDLEANVADIRRDATASRERAEEASAESQRLDGTLADCREKHDLTGSPTDLPDELAGLEGRYLLLEHVQPPLREGPIRGILVRTLGAAHGATAQEAVSRLEPLPRPLAHAVVGPDGVVPLLPDERVVPGAQAVTNPDAASGGSDAEAPEGLRRDAPEAFQTRDGAELADPTSVGTGAGIEQGTLTLAIAGWGNSSETHEVLWRAAAWCRERIRLYAIPVRHVDHAGDSAIYEGLVGEWEVAGSGTQGPAEFPWDQLLDLIESTDAGSIVGPLATQPCEDIQKEADEARRHATEAEEEARRAEEELREAEQDRARARRELADCEGQQLQAADDLVDEEPSDEHDEAGTW